MAKRIAIAGIWHETNTFVPQRTTFENFRESQLHAGVDLIVAHTSTGTEPGGAIAAAREQGAEPVPLLFAGALPGGYVDRDAFETFSAQIIEGLQGAGRIDGVVLCLHGAMVVSGHRDPEAELLEAVRAQVGDVPIGVTLDLHANIDDRLAESADVLVVYRRYPHTDAFDRGHDAMRLVLRMLEDGTRPDRWLVKLPLLTLPSAQDTSDEPMRTIVAKLEEFERVPGVWTVSVVPGFVYADVDRLGFAVYVASDSRARLHAEALARMVWDLRHAFTTDLAEPEDAIEIAARGPFPAVLVDVADNVGGGGTGDGTVLLHGLERRALGGCVTVIWDPRAVERVYASDDESMTLEVGAHSSPTMGTPVRISGRVRRPGHIEYGRSGSYMPGQHVDMGRVAVVESLSGSIVLTELRIAPFDLDHLRVLDIEPTNARILVVKGAIAWKAAFGVLAASTVYARTPGYCPGDLRQLVYAHRPIPSYPLEPAAWGAVRAR